MVFPIAVPLVMARVSIAAGVALALVLSSIWFIAMLKTSEMPHRGFILPMSGVEF